MEHWHNVLVPVLSYSLKHEILTVGAQMAGEHPQPLVWCPVDLVVCFVNRLHWGVGRFVSRLDWVKEQLALGRPPAQVMQELWGQDDPAGGEIPIPDYVLRAFQEEGQERPAIGHDCALQELWGEDGE